MKKIFKKNIIRKIKNYNQKSRNEFKETMSDLLSHEQLRRLGNYKQHVKSTRLEHSIDVAYYSFYIAKLFNLDYISTGKAGLLHDFSFHENQGFRKNMKMLRQHPKDALKNALKICDLSEKECDIIIRHMWLLTLRPPKYTEGYIVSFVDKYCAAKEFFKGVFIRKRKSLYTARRF